MLPGEHLVSISEVSEVSCFNRNTQLLEKLEERK